MKAMTRLLLCATLLAAGTAAHAERTFNQAELDALLAPVALYPDALLSNVLSAAAYPEEVRDAAAWSRANPQLRGDEALRAVESMAWAPGVKALVAFPDLLARMDESPAWVRDLGDAYRLHGPYVMDTVQTLRRRAQTSGNLRSDGQRQVYDEDGAIAIAPASPQIVYVPSYDPYVVYGGWWWPAYRPVVWAPWPVYGVYVSVGYVGYVDWRRRVVVVDRPAVVNPPAHAHHPDESRGRFREDREPHRSNGAPSPAAREQQRYSRERQEQQRYFRERQAQYPPRRQTPQYPPRQQAQQHPPRQQAYYHVADSQRPSGARLAPASQQHSDSRGQSRGSAGNSGGHQGQGGGRGG